MSILQMLATLASAQVGTDQQFLRPIADDAGGFNRFPGGGGRFDKIDEVVRDDDATYIFQAEPEPSQQCDFELTNSGIITPHPSQSVSFHFWQKDVVGTGLSGPGWGAELYEGDPSGGGTLRATLFSGHFGPPNGTYVDISDTLNPGEKASITDWNNLWLRITAHFTGAGNIWRLTQVYGQIDPL